MELPEEFEIDFDTIHKEWSEHLDYWLKGECKLEPICEFLVSRAISQMVKKMTEGNVDE